MPILLPEGTYAVPASDKDLLAGPRHTSITVEMLTRTEEVLGPLPGVLPGGSLAFSSSASIKSSGKISVRDLGEGIDWLNVRIKPTITITGPNGDSETTPLGVYLATAPKENWTADGRVWDVELHDKAAILDQDVAHDLFTGDAPTYSLPAGANVITEVIWLIEGAGESVEGIEPDPNAYLAGPMFWDVNTSRLKVINDMLSAANYFSLWTDEHGRFRCTKYTEPSSRPTRFLELRPFTSGPTSVVEPTWTKDVDIFSIPNRVLAIQQGSGDEAGLIATVENTNPASPYSYQARGRWITKVYDGVEATSLASLTAYAKRMLTMNTSSTGGAKIKHLFMPGLRINDVIEFTNPGFNARCTVNRLEIPLDPLGLCSSDLTEIVEV